MSTDGCTLPLDIIYEIIDTLCTAPSPFSRTQPPCVLRTLCALALVSRAVHARAICHLYRDLRLPTPCSLALVIDSNYLLQPGRPVRSLSLFQPARAPPPRPSCRPLPCADPPDLFLRLLLLLSPTLEHLTLTGDLTPIGHPTASLLNSSMHTLPLPRLRSLSLARQPHHAFPHFWFPEGCTPWPEVERVVLHRFHPVSAEQCYIAHRCPGLRRLVVGFNAWDFDGSIANAMLGLARPLTGLTELRVVYPGVGKQAFLERSFVAEVLRPHLSESVRENPKRRAAGLLPHTKVLDIDVVQSGVKLNARDGEGDVGAWVERSVADGSVWEMEGRGWEA
ncbi:hypothetical protein CALCODRAFT_488786 [Calocera cornea HHB12733]|uniref:Uncharacterized protein n=1 Tax=Calocera cornea HHB12733 TaxID=1353952 RepID=A0A165C6Y0_9BASI|nr:hypothetical protein CALCODRAFT_488786 [Calocera cornea HHB12733]